MNKRTFSFRLILLSLCISLLSACGTYRYQQTNVNSYMFEDKGDLDVTLNINELAGLSAAYAITDHFGASAKFAGFGESDSLSAQDSMGMDLGNFNYVNNINEFDFSGIYFNKIDDDFSFECQAGYGRTFRVEKVQTEFDLSTTGFNFTKRVRPMYNRFYIQPALGKNGENIDYNFGMRMQWVTYTDQASYSDFVIEPVFTARAGFRYVKFMFQLGGRFASNNGPYDYIPLHLGLGITAQINRYVKKSPEL